MGERGEHRGCRSHLAGPKRGSPVPHDVAPGLSVGGPSYPGRMGEHLSTTTDLASEAAAETNISSAAHPDTQADHVRIRARRPARTRGTG